MIRAYICPVIGTGTKQDLYRSKGMDFGYQCANFIPSLTGAPSSTWALAAVRAADFTAIDADTTCDDLFQGDLPANVNTRDDLAAYLRSRTISDVPLARRTAITAVLDKYAVDRTDFTGQTPLWRVLQRVVSTLFGTKLNEIDQDFPGF